MLCLVGCRYGIRSLVYLKDKSELVLQPTSSLTGEGVNFGPGTVTVMVHSVTFLR